MSAKDVWTPYGLEAIRVGYLRRRRVLSLLIALGLAGLWMFSFETLTSTENEIYVNGRRAGSIDIEVPEEREDGPVSVEILPGRVTRAESGGAPATGDEPRRPAAPVFTRANPLPLDLYVYMYGPYVLLAAALYFLAKKRGKHDQVNFGIYKGAMPLEMISSSMSDRIFTSKEAKTGLFGKRRADHLTEEILRVERVPQEEVQGS